jgi:phage shock protein E
MNWLPLALIGLALLGLFIIKRSSLLPAEEARRLLREGALVIDVRSPAEFNSRHLPGAINMPLGELRAEITRQVPDKDKVLLLHCLSGTRSGMAKQQLKQMGYAKAFNLGPYGRAEDILRSASGISR